MTPAELLMSRKLHTPLDLLHPDIEKQVQSSLERQKTSHYKRVKDCEFNLEDAVYVKKTSEEAH